MKNVKGGLEAELGVEGLLLVSPANFHFLGGLCGG